MTPRTCAVSPAPTPPSLSIIIPLYGVKPYLDALFASLEQQTNRNFELILVDDGSTDGSRERAEEEIQKQNERNQLGDPARYQLLLQSNQGVGVARNLGLRHASSQYIWWVDGDDRLEVDAVSQILEGCAQYPEADWLLFDFCTETAEGKWLANHSLSLSQAEKAWQSLLLTPVAPWSKVFRLSWLQQNQLFFPEKLRYEDLGFFLEGLCHKPKWDYLPHSLYRYRLRPASAMHVGLSPHHTDLLRILEQAHGHWEERGLLPTWEQEWETVSAYHGYLSAITRLLRAGATSLDLNPYQTFRKRYCPNYRSSSLLTGKQKLLGWLYDRRLFWLARRIIGNEPF